VATRTLAGGALVGGLTLALSGCSLGASPAPTAVPTFPPAPTATVPQLVQVAAQHGPSWLDDCPQHTGRLQTSFFLTSYPGTVQADGYCTTYVQIGPHSDLISFRAAWTAPAKYGGKGSYTLTYLMPRNANAATLPQLVGQKGSPP
jgi:hypothetical protein